MMVAREKIEEDKEVIKIIVILATKGKSSLERIEMVKKEKDTILCIPMSVLTVMAFIAGPASLQSLHPCVLSGMKTKSQR